MWKCGWRAARNVDGGAGPQGPTKVIFEAARRCGGNSHPRPPWGFRSSTRRARPWPPRLGTGQRQDSGAGAGLDGGRQDPAQLGAA